MSHSQTTQPSNHRIGRPPMGFQWRSSYWFTTFVVTLGIATDLLVYSIIIPVMPFQLQNLGYKDVSALSGWLLFAYSAGLVLSTIPIAMFSEHYNSRKVPLIIGLIILLGSQIMLMEAPLYLVMCIARILQGMGSSMVWVVGLALLCDSTPEPLIGRQLGIAMAGLSAGLLIGPPAGGVLYKHFGFRGPFIFSIIVTVIDLIGRLAIIEHKDTLVWGSDPVVHGSDTGEDQGKPNTECAISAVVQNRKSDEKVVPPGIQHMPTSMVPPKLDRVKTLSLVAVIVKLSKSSRALVSIFITLIYGVVYTSQEPATPLHLQDVWGLDSGKVGLVFLAAVVPTIFSSPLSGWLTDHNGPEWITFLSLILALPWWIVIIIQGPLSLFTAAFAIEIFFTSGVISPLIAELAAISREIEGVGYAHIYGAFNLAYGIGSVAGPIAGGQIYDHAKHGWMALCLLAASLLVVALILSIFFVGADPLLTRLRWCLNNSEVMDSP
ncbi:major facilitator superfamily domain-containing protein [Collybia nuda]|uniref:Major facilitator superfamily domain-containing protein n=1 Tax=Collybia nuda TaxID=64659 RepID=A0A9P5XXA8_9AGAR|nr:major facilitator superfamily domain-containing protein [Collybia nuda]